MKSKSDILLECPNPFNVDDKTAERMKFEAFKEIFTHHFNNCEEYRRYAEVNNVRPDDIRTFSDIVKIPPVPSEVFRDIDKIISSVPEKEIVMVATTSSTTSKKPCKYPLDAVTLRRTTQAGVQFLRDIDFTGGSAFMLTPSPEESDTGLVKGMSYVLIKGLNFGNNVYFAVKGGKFETERLISQMKSCKERPRHIYGPPFALMHLIEYVENNHIDMRLDKGTRVVTTGGWKTVQRDVTKSELVERVSKAFGIKGDQIRDGYGLTDIYTMIVECENHQKHVPPWVHVSARDPSDINKEVPDGESGLLALMTCIVNSYPAFVITGDMGAVWKSKCKCGRSGYIVEHRGRATKLGARGCAIRLEQFMEAITNK